jgi:hypothetical protein
MAPPKAAAGVSCTPAASVSVRWMPPLPRVHGTPTRDGAWPCVEACLRHYLGASVQIIRRP